MGKTNNSQVLVVGAGPTGLTAAIELARHGISVRVVDKVLPRPATESRAIGTHSRTMEIFECIGVLPKMLEAGRTIRGFSFYAEGKQIGRLGFEELDAPYPFVLILQQAETERFLIERLSEFGVEVERPKELVAFEQNAEGVRVKLRGAEAGEEEDADFSYLVAADGAHSTVRKQLGLSFEGNKTEAAYVADARIDWEGNPPDTNDGNMFLGLQRMLIMGLLPSGLWRIGATMEPDDEFMQPEKPSLELLQGIIDEQGNVGARLREIVWSSTFKISYRKVEKLRHGRVFLAGDAAHIHSPAGGQGMNTGVQDAFNLAWKLALNLKGAGGEKLLESYHAERYPIIEKLLPTIEQSEQMIMVKNPLAAKLRNLLLSIVSDFGLVQSYGSRALGGFLVNYRRSPIVGDYEMPILENIEALFHGDFHPNPLDEIDFARAPQAGDRAPDATEIVADGVSRCLFEILNQDVRHQLLVFAGEIEHAERSRELKETLTSIEKKYGAWIKPYLVQLKPSEPDADVAVLGDLNGEMHRRYGARHECLYLVRPDGYIGFRSQPVEPAQLRNYLADALGI
jgi:2-polyprenyl-6-methoxyphenol hydroxylase-like FAD-dependent oxidoreductase